MIQTTNKTKSEITKGNTELTREEIKTIALAGEAACLEIESLLAIIDRITGTRWESDHENL